MSDNPDPLEPGHGKQLLASMQLIRRFEEKCAELYSAARIRGFVHLYIGEEAIAVGAMQALTSDDAVIAHYRDHGHALARGISPESAMAEMFGKVEGCSGGRGGSMHLFDRSRRFYGGQAIVGGGVPVAVGLALADKMLKRPNVTACFFGDGATAEGVFYESLNLAALWQTPVLFLCENNLYAMGTALARYDAQTDIARKAESQGVPSVRVDGMDVLAVERAVRREVEAIRNGGGPRFLELQTYRFRAHSMFDPDRYRDKEEIARWKQRDPIKLLATRMQTDGSLTAEELQRIEQEADATIARAVAFAEAGTLEPVEHLTRFVTTPRDQEMSAASKRTTYREAIRDAIREAMQRDPRVFLMGEDVGRYGGAHAVSLGLLEEFGPDRVRDTPLSENGFVGLGIGAALGGLRPIVEVMTVNFSLLALDQIVNNAATLLHMSGGQFSVPIVIRMTTGGGRQLAAQHSHSFEVWYAHVPGLRVLAPATIEDARGMLWPALQDPDPVLIFEHGGLYNMEGDAADGTVDLSRALVRRAGRDISVIAYGASVHKALAAAEQLASEGIDVEVVDLRSLRPLDDDTLLASVRKTHRAVIVDEGWRTCSLAAEISTRIMEGAFYDLEAPIGRVCTVEVPIPYPKHLEDAALPQVAGIVASVRETARTHG